MDSLSKVALVLLTPIWVAWAMLLLLWEAFVSMIEDFENAVRRR